MMSTKGTVCVTGASGFVGSHVVKALLERGYSVRGTVRNPENAAKVDHLLSLPHADRLQLVKADLLEEGAFDAAVDGCGGVFHTASPFFFAKTDNPDRDLIQPAVSGTLNVLGSCKRAASVKRVVLTSSMVAIMFKAQGMMPNYCFSESDWSDIELMQSMKQFYALSKTMAEESAWEFMADSLHFTLATINPTMVIGPMLQPTLNTSSELILKMCNGARAHIPHMPMSFVDVRDVAEAHVLVYEKEEARGRHICVSHSTDWIHIASILRDLLPEAPIPRELAPGKLSPVPAVFTSPSKLDVLGWRSLSLKQSLADTVASLQERKYFNDNTASRL